MKISELKPNQGKVDIEVTIKNVGEARVFNKFGKDLRVANAIVTDETGETTLSLWNDDIDKVKEGDKVKISNGYVSQFNGKNQLTSGKFGNIEILKETSSNESSSEKPPVESSEKPHKATKKHKKDDEVEF